MATTGAEDVAPLGETEVGGEDQGAALVAGIDELEEETAAAGDDGEIADIVDDQEAGPAEEADPFLQAAFALGSGERREVDALALLDASTPRALARWFLPVPGRPREWTTSERSMKPSWASVRIWSRSSEG